MSIQATHPGFHDSAYRERRDYIGNLDGDERIYVKYTEAETLTWRNVSTELMKLYPTRACNAYNESLAASGITTTSIPQFTDINASLSDKNFYIQPVSGLITSRSFLEKLDENIMLCTRYIRHHESPEYTPEPDILHEFLGHCVFFQNHLYREVNRSFGKAAKKASDSKLLKIARLYWYTIEFGLCTEGNEYKAYGAGLLSSIKELQELRDDMIEPLDFADLTRLDYDTMNTHSKLYASPYSYEKTMTSLMFFLDSF